MGKDLCPKFGGELSALALIYALRHSFAYNLLKDCFLSKFTRCFASQFITLAQCLKRIKETVKTFPMKISVPLVCNRQHVTPNSQPTDLVSSHDFIDLHQSEFLNGVKYMPCDTRRVRIVQPTYLK